MRFVTKNLLWLLLLLPVCAFTQTSVVGNWKFEIPDENGNMTPVKLTLTENSYVVDFGIDGTADIEGKYTMEDNKMTISDTGGPLACLDMKGIYAVEVSETTLSMTRISDACEGRGGPEGKMVFERLK